MIILRKNMLMEALLNKDILTTADFFAAYPDTPSPTVYSRIRKLLSNGSIQAIGKGVYTTVPKPVYRPEVTPLMREVADLLIEECEGVNNCISQAGANLKLEVDKSDMEKVRVALSRHGYKVLFAQEAKMSPVPLEGFVILAPFISEMPMFEEGTLQVPSLEKAVVDSFIAGELTQLDFQKTAESYAVNYNRLLRYASRRGVKKEIQAMIQALNQDRLQMISTVQKFFRTSAVTKAWVFGSFARGEETPESDLDLLVEYDKAADFTLLDMIQYSLDIKKQISREVDLIENGYLRPFAVASANHDKFLIYER